MTRLCAVLLFLGLPLVCLAQTTALIKRVLPPEGLEIPADVKSRLTDRLASLRQRLEALPPAQRDQPTFRVRNPWQGRAPALRPDIDVFLKAVDYAIRHREFYVPKDFEKADWALEQAEQRIATLEKGTALPEHTTGLVVGGYRSRIDNSPQPYGLVIPAEHNFSEPCPLYVWLHGRGDKSTDLHFLYERATRKGQIAPPGAIVLHAFGRQCVGYKSAGEVDVHEAVEAVQLKYRIDPQRLVLIGFSMGGAGAWQVGAHSASKWAAIAPGAGFAETARYVKLPPQDYPPQYEQQLWGQNDVPNYVRNLFNTEVIAYSGELDKQIQAARVMEEAYQAEGRTLTHLIGPGVEHKYEPATLAELLKRLAARVENRRLRFPPEVHLQTRTLRYSQQDWVGINGLEQHWADARVDAIRTDNLVTIDTKNVQSLFIQQPPGGSWPVFEIDGQRLTTRNDRLGIWRNTAYLGKRAGQWQWIPQSETNSATGQLHKHPRGQGPIDDAFVEPFLVVTPSGKSKNPRFQAWVEFELAHLRDRWRALMRGELPEIRDVDFQASDERTVINLVLFGDPDSNAILARMLEKTPVGFTDGSWTFGGHALPGNQFVPAFIYPRRFQFAQFPNFGFRYVVFNSGLTFREAHDRTNSLQNPKLPDWAIIDLTQSPDATAPGRIHDADFFDETWLLKRPPLAP